MVKLPSKLLIHNLIDDLRTFSWEAADTLLYYSQIIRTSSSKDDLIRNEDYDNPVTLADLEVNKLIINRINEKYQNVDWEILSEENVKTHSDSRGFTSDWIWVFDPLDGTKDFIQGTSNFAMHLALNYKNRPYIGVVLIPEKNELWLTNGERTWCEKRDGFSFEPNISKNKSLDEMSLVTSKNHRNPTLQNLINKINFKKVIIMGSIGCKISSIIRGESDIYICLSMPGQSAPKDWDFAAPEAILKANGGAITNIYNEDLIYNQTNFNQGGIIIASNNKRKHENLCFQIKDVIQKNKIYPLNL